MREISDGGPKGPRRAIARRSDQDGRRAGLPGNNREPRRQTKTRGRRGKRGKWRGKGRPRRFLREYPHCRMNRSAAGAGAEWAIVIVARGAVAAIGKSGLRVVKWAGNVRLSSDAPARRVGRAVRACLVNHRLGGLRGKSRRMQALHGRRQLGKAGKQDEAKASHPR